MRVVEIFSSIEGEGKRAGKLCTFVRLAGCNLKCSYCDTLYAQEKTCGKVMSVNAVCNEIVKLGNYFVTITGGEPLLHNNHVYSSSALEGLPELINALTEEDEYEVNIETNGSISILELPFKDNPNVFFTIDFKCPSSGMCDKMFVPNFFSLNSSDVVKFVVADSTDMEKALEIISWIKSVKREPEIYFSPVYGANMPAIVQFMKDHKLQNVTLQVQLHKIIWSPEERGV